MTTEDAREHDATIVEQFTKQAIPFTEKMSAHQEVIRLLLAMSQVTSEDGVLDVACGPGLVACEFARTARHVTGIDITEKMVEQARKRQQELGLANLSWDVGTVSPLSYRAGRFSVVITRYSFHHFLDPRAVLSEMCRVCRPGGTVLIADVAPPAEKAEAFNHVEKLRDPSHTRALSPGEFEGLLEGSGLRDLRRASTTVKMELEQQLRASFPLPGDDERIRKAVTQDVGVNALGMDAHRVGNAIYLAYPIGVYAGTR